MPPSLQKAGSSSSSKNQKSILGFFQKKPAGALQPQVNGVSASAPVVTTTTLPIGSPKKKALVQESSRHVHQTLTPAPSSDAVVPEDDDDEEELLKPRKRVNRAVNLPSPITPGSLDGAVQQDALPTTSSPSRKVRKAVNYAESSHGSDQSEDEDAFIPEKKRKALVRGSKRRRTRDSSEDNYSQEEHAAKGDTDEEDDFIVPDDSEEETVKKRKRPTVPASRKSSSPPNIYTGDADLELPTVSTAQQWSFDPEAEQPSSFQAGSSLVKQAASHRSHKKQKAHTTEPENRYTWLANILDADRNPPGHPDYDPRTIYIPPLAWTKFSPFESQYWEIKQKFWDTIVFFKKGKFYELYEKDATIGHQLFDLKLTDRVNMRMVGVPESSLNHWATQFVAKGYKIARVDQMESALAKQMRDGKVTAKSTKEDKVVRRELACVLTAGTLVESGMLQDDMATYCCAIKESVIDDLPAFGIAFVDAATGQFSVTEFVDDIDLTKFETFVAQTKPQELLLEKSCLSTKALRILKNNTGPTTIWNNLKPGKEFWDADITIREVDVSDYFVKNDEDKTQDWPEVLESSRDKTLLWSAFGGLIWYLRNLKIDRDLLTLKHFTWYDPIKRQSTLVLDGQTLINLEIFANSVDGGVNGTLFLLLNRCVTPFGKRMFKQWVCHPLMDADKINARLDAVDSLNADSSTRDSFTSSLTKIPDLERLISRVHAGSCKALDFVRVLEGFEQIDYTMGLIGSFGTGDGLIGQLITAMPDIASLLKTWSTAFDRSKVKEHGILVPEPGVEQDYDESEARIEEIIGELNGLLKDAKKMLGTNHVVFRDNGKEIYQLEISASIKSVPKTWDQMSATKAVKRYYTPELRALIRQLQEAQETHGQIVKEVAGRFYARFDEDYITWLNAIKIVAQLDCLISLAKASSSLGEPSCRPIFVQEENNVRSVLDFEDLRHPCMASTSTTDFIPNDIRLGGREANISLLTGANAAGKSTILRMTCIAVIMAQIGCHVPCSYARLTPVDRIMSRLGANDNIFAAQSTFFVELSETKKILSEATPRSLVILDELGRGTSSYDGVAVAQAVLHHVATHIGCIGFFATHYHSLAEEFANHPEVTNKRMRIHVDEANRQITFLYKLEEGVAEGSFGMHCAAMCGIPEAVIKRAEVAAREWEHTSRLKERLEKARRGCYVPLGWQSDVAWLLKDSDNAQVEGDADRGLDVLRMAIASL